MRLRPSTYFAIAIMAVMLVVIGKALTFRYYQTALLPVLGGSLVLILAGIQAVKEILGNRVTKVQEKAPDPPPREEEIQYVKKVDLGIFAAWFLGFCLAVYLLGHLLAVLLFMLSYVKWRGKSWGVAIVAAVCITACIYILFPLAFKVELYPGFLYELIFGE